MNKITFLFTLLHCLEKTTTQLGTVLYHSRILQPLSDDDY